MDIRDDTYTVTAMKETLDKSNLGLLKTGDLVNLEVDVFARYVARLMEFRI